MFFIPFTLIGVAPPGFRGIFTPIHLGTTSGDVAAVFDTKERAEAALRDLVASPLSHLTLGGSGDADVLDEFLAADTIVVGAPMYNFGVPSQLNFGAS